ncbi:Cytochrome c oxidase subunit 6A, mitochondrial [Serendipita sp. 400]|nr:Cytochrome c oxidase subunit 6A, mitochondrial [Serendipita sp. 400]
MQRPSALRVVRSLRAPTRASTRKYAMVPAPEPGFPTGEEFLSKKEAVKHHAAHTTSLWKNISIFACVPVIIGAGYYVYDLEQKHAAHKAEHPHEYIGSSPPTIRRSSTNPSKEYPYLNRRPRQFPWGPNSLFFNPHVQKDMTPAE